MTMVWSDLTNFTWKTPFDRLCKRQEGARASPSRPTLGHCPKQQPTGHFLLGQLLHCPENDRNCPNICLYNVNVHTSNSSGCIYICLQNNKNSDSPIGLVQAGY